MATLEPAEAGVVMRCTTNNLEWLGRQIISFGCPWTIEEPQELREVMSKLAGDILRALDGA